MTSRFLYLLFPLLCASCQNKVVKEEPRPVSTLDSALQAKVTHVLNDKMTELAAHDGQVIVMEVQTGAVKAMVGLRQADSTFHQSTEVLTEARSSGLMQGVSVMAALASGRSQLSDSVDVGNGVQLIRGGFVRDHNWHRGGYGMLNVERALQVGSNIGIVRTVERAFDHDSDYFDMLDRMGYGCPDSIPGLPGLKKGSCVTPQDTAWDRNNFPWVCLGYEHRITPIQMLTFYNAIANGGVMVRPSLFTGDTDVINPQIASKESIVAMQQALESTVSKGLAKPAQSALARVAGKTGTVQLLNDKYELEDASKRDYLVQFCGYFPAEAPRYSIIVSISKPGYPASGGTMAGSVFSKIVDYIMEKK